MNWVSFWLFGICVLLFSIGLTLERIARALEKQK